MQVQFSETLLCPPIHGSILNVGGLGQRSPAFGFYTPILCRILADFCILDVAELELNRHGIILLVS